MNVHGPPIRLPTMGYKTIRQQNRYMLVQTGLVHKYRMNADNSAIVLALEEFVNLTNTIPLFSYI